MKRKEESSAKVKAKTFKAKESGKKNSGANSQSHEYHGHGAKHKQHNFMYDFLDHMMKLKTPDFSDFAKNSEMQHKQMDQVIKARNVLADLAQNMSNIHIQTVRDNVEEMQTIAHNMSTMKTFNPLDMMHTKNAMMDKTAVLKKYQEICVETFNEATQSMMNLAHASYNQNMDR